MTIYDLIGAPKFAALRTQNDLAAWRTIAGSLNARPETESPNPVTEAPVVFREGEFTLLDIAKLVTPAEYVVLADEATKINGLATTIGTPEAQAAVQQIGLWMLARGQRNASVYDVAEEIMEAKNTHMMQALIGLVIQAGHLSMESAAALQAAMLEPDPNWSATVTEFGQSPAQKVGYEWITPENVGAYIQELNA